MKPKTKWLICGYFIASSINGLWQDSMGKDCYIQVIQEHWTNSCVTAPIHLALLAIALWAIIRDEWNTIVLKESMRELEKRQEEIANN